MQAIKNGALFELDARNLAILAERIALFDARRGARTGDFVRFSDGTLRRISYHWGDLVQTSDLAGLSSGRFYFGDEGCSFSGGLHPGIPASALRPTDETRTGAAWFFDHNEHCAHNGIDVAIPFRVFAADVPARR